MVYNLVIPWIERDIEYISSKLITVCFAVWAVNSTHGDKYGKINLFYYFHPIILYGLTCWRNMTVIKYLKSDRK
jgi:hypothetical protein